MRSSPPHDMAAAWKATSSTMRSHRALQTAASSTRGTTSLSKRRTTEDVRSRSSLSPTTRSARSRLSWSVTQARTRTFSEVLWTASVFTARYSPYFESL